MRKLALIFGGKGWGRVLIHRNRETNKYHSILKSKLAPKTTKIDCSSLMERHSLHWFLSRVLTSSKDENCLVIKQWVGSWFMDAIRTPQGCRTTGSKTKAILECGKGRGDRLKVRGGHFISSSLMYPTQYHCFSHKLSILSFSKPKSRMLLTLISITSPPSLWNRTNSNDTTKDLVKGYHSNNYCQL